MGLDLGMGMRGPMREHRPGLCLRSGPGGQGSEIKDQNSEASAAWPGATPSDLGSLTSDLRTRGARAWGWARAQQMKGIWWMPWHREAMKDVARCEKPRGSASDC